MAGIIKGTNLFPKKEQLHKLALFRLGEEMTEGGMTGNNKILCGGGKVSRGKGCSSSLPVMGHQCGKRQWHLRTQGHFVKQFGIDLWKWWPWVEGRCEKLVRGQKAIKQIPGKRKPPRVGDDASGVGDPQAAGVRSTACSARASALPRALAVGLCPREDGGGGGGGGGGP